MNPGLKGIMAKLETADQYIVAVANDAGMTVLVRSSDGFISETIKELAEEMADNHECEHCSCKDFAESFKESEPQDLEEEVVKLQAEVSFLRTALNIWSGGAGKNNITMKEIAEELTKDIESGLKKVIPELIKNAEQEGDN